MALPIVQLPLSVTFACLVWDSDFVFQRSSEAWRVIAAKNWRRMAHIESLACEAGLWTARSLARFSGAHGRRQYFLIPWDGFAPLQKRRSSICSMRRRRVQLGTLNCFGCFVRFSGGFRQKSILLMHRHDALTSHHLDYLLTSHSLRCESAHVQPWERSKTRHIVCQCQRRYACFCSVLLAFNRMDSEE